MPFADSCAAAKEPLVKLPPSPRAADQAGLALCLVPKNYPVLVVVRPVVSHNRATIHQDARNNLGQRNKGIRMRGSRRWSAEEKELERTIPMLRAAPGEVLAEREAAWAAELTPNMVVLGDPLPGRSALDAKYRTSLH